MKTNEDQETTAIINSTISVGCITVKKMDGSLGKTWNIYKKSNPSNKYGMKVGKEYPQREDAIIAAKDGEY
tara:strand:+ start:199 stop:411 length:213 start_codon:yes stop_codon:yes gene_type:complete